MLQQDQTEYDCAYKNLSGLEIFIFCIKSIWYMSDIKLTVLISTKGNILYAVYSFSFLCIAFILLTPNFTH